MGFVALGGFVPMLFGVFSLVSRRVVAMFHFTLAESSRGLRVTRGLTNLSSQSVPVDRIQGVRLCQPALWKPFGWWRVDVDIVGYASNDREDNSGGATSVLLPVASQAQVRLALSRVLPGFAVEAIELHARTASGPGVPLVRLVDPALRLGRPRDRHRSTAGSSTSGTSSRTPRPSRCASSRARCSAGSGWPTCTSTPPRARCTRSRTRWTSSRPASSR